MLFRNMRIKVELFQMLEAQKKDQVQKKLQQAQAKKAEYDELFAQEAELKLQKRLEINKENKEAQTKALQDRLKERVRTFTVVFFSCCTARDDKIINITFTNDKKFR